tara:strand:- start:603 stop:866 length:264 start_codon:yes stop_codon:yes gene_type:complete
VEIKADRFLVKENSYIVDLFSVDFITFKENEKEFGTYWIKLHIGTKEVRYICKDASKLNEVIETWCKLHGEELNFSEQELVGETKWD